MGRERCCEMPKVAKARKSKQRLATAAASSVGLSTGADLTSEAKKAEDDSKLSRGQRKRQEKRMRVLQKLTMTKPVDEDPDALGQYGALAASINDVAASKHGAKPAVMTKKKKNILIQQECTQFGNVLSHPSFQDNPLATLQTHLQSVIGGRKARQEKERQGDSTKKKVTSKTSTKKKSKGK